MGDTAAPRVAAEAAIALGRMYDPRARTALRALVHAEDADLRIRAAVSLGRLRDREAVPALIEALWIATAEYERHETVRWLGRLRDPRALEPLIATLPDLRGRFLVVAAIGQLGDRRAFEPLARVLRWDNHANVRDGTLQGLGWLGDPRAVPLITTLAAEDASLKLATESLVRLGALQLGAIGGSDVARQNRLADFTDCYEGPLMHDWDYLHRTSCVMRASSAALELAVPEAVSQAEQGIVVVLGAKRSDAAAPAPLRLTIGGRALAEVAVDGSWDELRWTLPAGSLAQGRVQARLQSDEPARFAIDHLLLLPRSSIVVAQRGP
jgi:hypothetical protein